MIRKLLLHMGFSFKQCLKEIPPEIFNNTISYILCSVSTQIFDTLGTDFHQFSRYVDYNAIKDEATKAECFEITEKLINFQKDADLKNKQWRFLHSHHLKVSRANSENYPLTNIKLKSSKSNRLSTNELVLECMHISALQ